MIIVETKRKPDKLCHKCEVQQLTEMYIEQRQVKKITIYSYSYLQYLQDNTA